MRHQRYKTFLMITLLSLAFPFSAMCRGGGSDGGGNELVAAFTTKAHRLIQNFPFQKQDAVVLQDFLKKTKIISVKILIDPRTNAPVPNQNKILAWGSYRLIQLKESDQQHPDHDSWEKALQENRIVNHHLAHELFRASGIVDQVTQASIDDNYQISINKYHLDTVFVDELIYLKKAVIQKFISEANSNSSQLAKDIIKINVDTAEGRNPNGNIALPIRPSDIQVIALESTSSRLRYHKSEDDNTCAALADRTSFLLLLKAQAAGHQSMTSYQVLFQVTANEVVARKALSNFKEDCDAFDEDKYFYLPSKIEVSDFSLNQLVQENPR